MQIGSTHGYKKYGRNKRNYPTDFPYGKRVEVMLQKNI
jgi:hypothetical protein